ncbi:MAG: hypothetical protein ACKVE4_00455 [Dissulfuribacterales bacterium]
MSEGVELFKKELPRFEKQKEKERKERRAKINPRIAEKKKKIKKENDRQMTLFGDD